MTDEKFKELFSKHGPSQNQFELKNLMDWLEVAMPNPKTIVEVGVFRGGTFTFWRHILDKEGLLIGVDLNDRGYMYSIEQEYSQDKNTKFIVGLKSNEPMCVKKVKDELKGRPIDILFLDAGHRYEDVRGEFLNYGPLVRPGGLIIFHDIVGPELIKESEIWMFWRYQKFNLKAQGSIEFFGKDNPCGIGVIVK